MPTARELLEQADALMRRHRVGSGADPGRAAVTPGAHPPAIGPAPSPPAASPRTIQREPITPPFARTSLQGDPTESPAVASPSAEESASRAPTLSIGMPVSQADADAGFPLLTDALPEPAVRSAFDADLHDLGSPSPALDDVPVLTDAVEEIDVGIVAEDARGEPSFWELTTRGDASVLGPAPDSVLVVPPLESMPPAVPQAPLAGRDPLGLDQPPPGFDATGSANEDAEAALPSAGVLEPAQPAQDPLAATAHETVSLSADAAFDEAGGSAWGEEAVETRPDDDSGGSATTPEPDAPPAVPPIAAMDSARIREIAEEIGMQVLQRIDIFADTTLRAELGERLKPVVEKAGADLVAAINQNIGELLRAYVAEAIEREIESWRESR